MKRKIIPNQKYTTYASFPLVAGDVRAYEIQLDLGEDVENAEFKVTAFRSDGEIIEDLGSVEGGICRYTIQNNMYSVPGELTIRLAVVHNSSVLTDREIIFEVLSGGNATSGPSTAVTINDSVILRIASLEEKLSLKVDKQDGKGLSENDFTDDYKQKLDDLVCGVSSVNDKTGDVVISKEDVGLSNVDNTADLDKPVSSAVQEALDLKADKEKVEAELNKKADKSDITNLYKFKGSVDTYNDLYSITPILKRIPLIPAGEPVQNGEVCGSFDENANEVTIYGGGDDYNDSDISIPVKAVTLERGYYQFEWYTTSMSLSVALQDGTYIDARMTNAEHEEDALYSVFKVESEVVVDYAEILGPFYFNDETHNCLGVLYKISDVCVGDGYGDGYYPTTLKTLNNNADIGDTYNVTDTDINYAWNGKEWDALGGKHIDQEARDGISDLNEAVDELANTKADITYVDGRVNDECQILSDEISDLDARITENLSNKADASELSDVGAHVAILEDNVTYVEDVLNSKANSGQVANALRGSVSGEVVSLNDVSPVEHTLDVKVSSKNVLKYPYYYSTKTINGITYTDNGDGSITINGTATAFTIFELTQQSKMDCSELFEDGATYRISGITNPMRIVVGAREISTQKAVYYNNNATFTVDKSSYAYEWIRIQMDSGTTIENVTVYPQIEKGTTATEYTPYVDDVTGVKVTVSESGDVYIPNDDGTVDGVESIYPNMTLMTDTDGVVIDCKYNKDVNKVIETLTNAIISLGGNV